MTDDDQQEWMTCPTCWGWLLSDDEEDFDAQVECPVCGLEGVVRRPIPDDPTTGIAP